LIFEIDHLQSNRGKYGVGQGSLGVIIGGGDYHGSGVSDLPLNPIVPEIADVVVNCPDDEDEDSPDSITDCI
jgi:hypothetical protein